VTVLVSLLAIAVPYPEDYDSTSPPAVLRLAGTAVLTAAAIEVLQRWIVRRHRPVSAASLLAADDAIRSQSVHSVAGSGLGILSLVLGEVTWRLGLSDVQLLRWTIPLVGWLLPLAGFYACLWFGHRPWQVRRHQPQRMVPVAP
jgi:hypothetical protein